MDLTLYPGLPPRPYLAQTSRRSLGGRPGYEVRVDPPPSPMLPPRDLAMESSSSKKRTQGAAARALSNTSLTLASDSPNHMVSSSGPWGGEGRGGEGRGGEGRGGERRGGEGRGGEGRGGEGRRMAEVRGEGDIAGGSLSSESRCELQWNCPQWTPPNCTPLPQMQDKHPPKRVNT